MKLVQMLFPGGRSKSFTMSYDDGVIQDRRLVTMMDEKGIRGTFNLNSGFLGIHERAMIHDIDTDITKIEKEEVSVLYKNHEVATHGLTHLKMTDVGAEVAAYQIIEDRKNLEEITGGICKGFAYPFGSYDEVVINVLKSCGILYARTVESTGGFGIPEDFLKWHPTCHHDDARLMELAKDFCENEEVFGAPRLFYLWGHSYEFDQKDNWERIEELLDYIAGFEEKIWFATNMEIYKYVAAFRQLEYSVEGNMVYNPSGIDVFVSVDDKCYCIAAGQLVCI